MTETLNQTLQVMSKSLAKNPTSRNAEVSYEKQIKMFPTWMNWTIVITLIVIALSCLSNLAFNIFDKTFLPVEKTTIITDNKQ